MTNQAPRNNQELFSNSFPFGVSLKNPVFLLKHDLQKVGFWRFGNNLLLQEIAVVDEVRVIPFRVAFSI